MSLKSVAKEAHDAAKAAAEEQAEANAEAKIAQRAAKVVRALSPLVDERDVVLLDRSFKVDRLQIKTSGPSYGRTTHWEPVTYTGTRFKVDDIEVLVWADIAPGRSRDTLVGVLRTCAQCDAVVLPGGDYSADHVDAIYEGTEQPWQLEYRRKELTTRIGKALAGSKLCARHTAAKIDARCEHCGRPYGEDTR